MVLNTKSMTVQQQTNQYDVDLDLVNGAYQVLDRGMATSSSA